MKLTAFASFRKKKKKKIELAAESFVTLKECAFIFYENNELQIYKLTFILSRIAAANTVTVLYLNVRRFVVISFAFW